VTPTPPNAKTEERYLKLLMDPLEVCAKYKPKFGTVDKDGVTLEAFKTLYGDDPFYHWVGLDDDLMYAAHKAAGGMTSVYRQLGQGCEHLFRAIVRDSLGLSEEEVSWKYEITKQDRSKGVLTLDARIDLDHIKDRSVERQKVREWLNRCAKCLGYSKQKTQELRGAVFEARQGYKSADAKRQNADLRFATNALADGYLPVLSVISTQTSESVIRRYRNAKMLVITGTKSTDDTVSTYAFFRNVVSYSLDEFFQRNTGKMRERCKAVLEKLLTPA
jgi:hypothetical protein